MKPYKNNYSLKKKVSLEIKKNPKTISPCNYRFVNKIIDTVNISLLVLVLVLSFLSLDSQRKWTNTYKVLSKIKENNSNILDYISKTEEFYISKLESLNTFKKTTPSDLIYINRIQKKESSFPNKVITKIIYGLRDSKFQRGY